MSNKLKAKKNQRIPPPLAPVDKRLWYYTATRDLAKIIETGKIKVASMGMDPKEPPAVWFSSNSDFEQTAKREIRDKNSGAVQHRATRDEMFKAGFPPVRIEINTTKVRACDWETYKKISGISEEAALRLEEAGIEEGSSPSEWYASFQPVPLVGGCRFPIEIWNGRQWIDIEKARPESAGKKA